METDGPAVSEEALLCPGCGFDLRGTASDRCGECGLEFDRESLRESGIPWAHRKRIGWVKAFFKTVWQITRDPREMRFELAKPQDVSDARSFSRLSGILFAAALVIIFVATLTYNGSYDALAVKNTFRIGMRTDARVFDVLVPWSAGATPWPVLPVCVALLAIHFNTAQKYSFRLPSAPREHQQRAIALSYYTTAPLVLLLPAAICGVFAWKIEEATRRLPQQPIFLIVPILWITSILLGTFGTLITLRRIGQWIARTRHRGIGVGLFGVGLLIAHWLAGAIVLLGLLPWCVGFIWIAIDSLR